MNKSHGFTMNQNNDIMKDINTCTNFNQPFSLFPDNNSLTELEINEKHYPLDDVSKQFLTSKNSAATCLHTDSIHSNSNETFNETESLQSSVSNDCSGTLLYASTINDSSHSSNIQQNDNNELTINESFEIHPVVETPDIKDVLPIIFQEDMFEKKDTESILNNPLIETEKECDSEEEDTIPSLPPPPRILIDTLSLPSIEDYTLSLYQLSRSSWGTSGFNAIESLQQHLQLPDTQQLRTGNVDTLQRYISPFSRERQRKRKTIPASIVNDDTKRIRYLDKRTLSMTYKTTLEADRLLANALGGWDTLFSIKGQLAAIDRDLLEHLILDLCTYDPRVVSKISESYIQTTNRSLSFMIVLNGLREILEETHNKPQIICIARNYTEHCNELNNIIPKRPIFFYKSTSSIVFPPNPILLPNKKCIGDVQYEAELVIVISKQAQNIQIKDVPFVIAGVSVGIDVTARDVQEEEKRTGSPWTLSKSLVTFCPLCPDIMITEDMATLNQINIKLFQNGVQKQCGNTKNMIFKISEIVSYLSTLIVLNRGDIILTGTPAGVGSFSIGDNLRCSITTSNDQELSANFSVNELPDKFEGLARFPFL